MSTEGQTVIVTTPKELHQIVINGFVFRSCRAGLLYAHKKHLLSAK
jgi:hypothetical protein